MENIRWALEALKMARLPGRRRARLNSGAWGALVAALLGAAAPDTNACLQPPPQPPPVLIEMQPGNNARITVLGYTTGGTGPGQFCACALKRVLPITSINGMQVLNASNGAPVAGFNFQPNSATTFFFNTNQGGVWNGFHSQVTQPVPPGMPLRLDFFVALQPGTTPQQLTAALSSQGRIGTGDALPTGQPTGGNLAVLPFGPVYQGSVTLQLQPGFTAIGNNFWYPMDNTVARVLPDVAPDTVLYKFNAAAQQYEPANVFDEFMGWLNPAQTLRPGEGAWIYSPVPQTASFSGGIQPAMPATRPPPGFYLVSCREPRASSFEEMLGFPPVVGDRVYKYDFTVPALPGAGQGPSSAHTFGPGGWDIVPILDAGKAAFVELAGGGMPPNIIMHPQSVTVQEGGTAGFSVTATGGGQPFSYQWRHNGTNLPAQTNTTLTISNVTFAHAGPYEVVVTGSGGSSTSQTATLTVIRRNSPPQLAPIDSVAIHAGMAVQFTASATDTDSPPNQITFSLDPGAPPTAFIDPITGSFFWTPTDDDADLIHDITVRVTDNGSPPMSATRTFSVVVMPRPEMGIEYFSLSNRVVLTWSSIPGVTYRVLRAPRVNGPWNPFGPDVMATSVTTTKDDFIIPSQYYYRITTTTTPRTNTFSFCLLLKRIIRGPGMTADSITPAAGETMSMTKEKIPFIVKGGDGDQLIQTCVCFTFGGICASSRSKDIMDSVDYAWTLMGDGTLTGSGPAVIYQPIDLKVGETNLATITAEIADSRGNDGKATITYTVKIVREEECKYKRTVIIVKVVPPGAPMVVTPSPCGCVPEAPAWMPPPALAADAPAEIKVCAGARVVLTASGSDRDTLKLACIGPCGTPMSTPVLIDELKYTWSAMTGTFPDYGGAPESNSRRTSVIYKVPDMPGEDMVTVMVSDSGQGPDAPPVEKKIKVIVRKADLQIHKPKVIDPAETIIPDADELCKGSQTFVNLDNDDKDDKYDTGTTDTDVMDEDELVKVILRVEPKAATGTAKLTAPEGAGDIKVWTNATKKGTAYTLDTALALPDHFKEVGDGWSKEMWVEGITAHTNQRQTKLKMIYEEAPLRCEDDAALTIIGVKKLTWLGYTNGFTAGSLSHDSDTLGVDPNFPTAAGEPPSQRVFADARAPVFDVYRDKVGLEVELTVKPIEAVNIYLKAFDVDDPTSAADPIDPNDGGGAGTYAGTAAAPLTYTAEEDNRGAVGGKKAGELTGQDGDGIATLAFSPDDLKKTNDFKVAHHPGDNYRAVANGDKDFLKELRNLDKDDGTRVVEKNVTGTLAEREVRSATNYVSPVLTIWRLLHVERDSMAALTNNANNARGNVETLTAASRRVGIAAADLFLNNAAVATLDDGSEDADDNKAGRFENGTLTGLTGAGLTIQTNGNRHFTMDAAVTVAFSIKKGLNEKNGNMTDLAFAGAESTMTVNGIVMANDEFKDGTVTIRGVDYEVKGNTAASITTKTKVLIAFTAVDDDDNSVLPLATFADTSLMEQGFQAAYILPLNDGGGAATNDTTNLTSTVNLPNTEAAFEAFFSRQSAPNEKDSFWVVYILSAFQYVTTSDWDSDGQAGEGGTGGLTFAFTATATLQQGGHGCTVHRETIRDRLANGTRARAGLEARVTVHEVGHQFGLDHNTDIMMSTNQDGPLGADFHFSDMDLNLLRARVKSHGE